MAIRLNTLVNVQSITPNTNGRNPAFFIKFIVNPDPIRKRVITIPCCAIKDTPVHSGINCGKIVLNIITQ